MTQKMKRTSVQFYATNEELYRGVMDILHNKYKVYGVIDFPCFVVTELTEELDKRTFAEYRTIIASKNDIKLADSYNELISLQDNNFGIRIGKETDTELFESIIWVSSVNDIDSEWKKIISSIKKKTNKGAWASDPYGGDSVFYKNVLYSDGAKKAYENGIKIRPIAGWTIIDFHG